MMSKTYSENFEKRTEKEHYYISNHYEITMAAGGSQSRTKSILSRILNCVINTYNNKKLLPKWIVMVMENDLIRNYNCTEYGATEAYTKNNRIPF